MRLILVRHGETEENFKGIIQGQSVQGNLSKRGIQQAEQVAKVLKDIKIDCIYSSDLKRADDTATIISKFHPNAEFVLTKEIRERNWGIFEGKTKEEIGWEEIKNRYLRGFEKPIKGEDLLEFQKRIKNFLEKLKEKHKNQTILFICHKNVIRVLYLIITQTDLSKSPDFGFVSFDKFYEFKV